MATTDAENLLTPALGPDIPTGYHSEAENLDFAVKARAFSATIEYLAHRGMKLEYPTREDFTVAKKVFLAYAGDPQATNSMTRLTRMSKMTPPALRHIDAMLKTFGAEVMEDAVQLRHYVTNKLIEETDNPDPKVRMKALELLGKVTDVGLFTDRQEVTVTHQTSDDLREALRAKLNKLAKLANPEPEPPVLDAEIVEFPRIGTYESLTPDEPLKKPDPANLQNLLDEFDLD